jgi:hypothetical protein
MGLPITVSVGPLAAASATGISLSQAAAGAQHLVLNGAFASVDADAVALAQAVAGAGNLTLNGVTVNGGVARLGAQRRVYITSAGNDSGITFTVTGTIFSLSGPAAVVETVTGANAGVVSTSKVFDTVTQVAASGAAAGDVSVGMHGGTIGATLDKARRVSIDSDGNDSGITFTVAGTDGNGNPITETIAGGNATAVATALDFKTVTSILTSGAVATTVEVGTNAVAASRWVRFDELAGNAQVHGQCVVDGTVTYDVEYTLDDPNSIGNPVAEEDVTWFDHADFTAQMASKTGIFQVAPVFARVTLNTGTGSVRGTFVQSYLL